MAIYEVTLEDTDSVRGWKDEGGKPTNLSTITVDATSTEKAKEFAEEHNGDLKALEAKVVK